MVFLIFSSFFGLCFSFILWLFSYFLASRVFFSYSKSSPFECGFDSSMSARVPFSMRFFLLAVLFLIFDVEIVLLMPISLVMDLFSCMSIFILCLMFLIILLGGLFHEWKEGSLNWVM
uniref:NADH-ubiquinone oxidoreductase chain 3 n=1 Tax=Nectonemertes cf. mirabilis HC-2011 TaxID=992350 RepID=I1SR49_9BILA|nr:NADH dehydrogenase subunit 3 [Nectonemertes cf. mirabilis HC-2011]ADZ05369.1 NADH dehydrogenase subunit 3 [Nectonemertes cf. mirabilis HC-2011]